MQTEKALSARTDVEDTFDLDISAVERTDRFNDLVSATDNGCGSTCGACTTGVH